MRMLVFAAMAVLGTGLLLGQETTQASTGTSLPRRIASGIAEGNIVTKVPPVYPPIAQAAHVQGTVRLYAIIARDGRVKNLEVMDGPPMLTAAAVDSVKQWVYKPYLLNGEPTEVDTTISVRFDLADAGPGGQAGGDAGAGAPPPPPPPPPPVTIRGGLVPGRLLQRVAPVYPADAKAAGIEGTVVLKGLIGKDGTLKDLHVISGPQELRQAAIDAASQWVYSPYLLNGKPVEVDTTVSVNFNLAAR